MGHKDAQTRYGNANLRSSRTTTTLNDAATGDEGRTNDDGDAICSSRDGEADDDDTKINEGAKG